MKDLETNFKLIYNIAQDITHTNKGISPERAILSSVVRCLEYKDPENVLGNVYLDYLNYQNDFNERKFDKFYSFFDIQYPNRVEYMSREEKNRILNEIFSGGKSIQKNLVVCSRIAKEHFSVEEFTKHKERNRILHDD